MTEIGRKIYYSTITGEIILTISDRKGPYVHATSIEQDISEFIVLSERNRDTFDVIELEYGQYSQDFAECNGYRVNPETKTLEFSYPDPNEPNIEQPYQAPLSEQVKNLEATILEMTAYSATQDERLVMQEQALLELTTTIAGGNA